MRCFKKVGQKWLCLFAFESVNICNVWQELKA